MNKCLYVLYVFIPRYGRIRDAHKSTESSADEQFAYVLYVFTARHGRVRECSSPDTADVAVLKQPRKQLSQKLRKQTACVLVCQWIWLRIAHHLSRQQWNMNVTRDSGRD